MLTFATEFPINLDTALDELVQLAIEWIAGSPHTGFDGSDLKWDTVSNEARFVDEGETLEVLRFNEKENACGGVRYTKIERNKLEWVTTVVGHKNSERFLVSVRVSCDALAAGITIPTPRKPHVVKLVLERFGGGKDGDLEVIDHVHSLSNSHIDFAASMINGTTGASLPIVYVSASAGSQDAIDSKELAKWLGGVCHVVKEPNRAFAFRLMNDVGRRNAYGGAVGLYWPAGLGRKIYFAGDFSSSADMQREIANDARVGLAGRRPIQSCTWAHLAELSARSKYENLKADKSNSVDEYVTAFDGQLAAINEKLDAANKEIGRLQALVKTYEARSASREGSLLNPGDEQDFFEDEANDVLLDALEVSKQHFPTDSRRQHIIDSVLRANKKTGQADELSEQIKTVLRDYRSMDAKVRSALQDIGLQLSEDGRHYKATVNGDSRYIFTISKTSSDHRAGLNLASEIKKTLF